MSERGEFLAGLLEAGEPVEDIAGFSEATQRRAGACRVFLAQYFRDLATYRFQRTLRAIALEEDVAARSAAVAAACRAELRRSETAYLRLRRCKTRFADFALLALLGRGGFGEVYLARERRTGRIVALKRMAKAHVRQKNRVMTERSVLVSAASESTKSPWIVRLHCTFQDARFLYFAMQYAPGGDLRGMLAALGRLDEAAACFYCAEMAMAVAYLHSLGYVHRDVKPSNFVVDGTGHLLLIDFGLSMDGLQERFSEAAAEHSRLQQQRKQQQQQQQSSSQKQQQQQHPHHAEHRRSYAIVGSPDYMPVEMLEGCGYDVRGDWWSLGCILYEMVAGFGPFAGTSADQVFGNVLNWRALLAEKPLVPETEAPISDSCWDLIKRLICEADKRADVQEIRRHRWFAENGVTDWDKLREHESPFTPVLESDCDTSYFSDVAAGPADAAAAASAAADAAVSAGSDIAEAVREGSVPTGWFHSSNDDDQKFIGFTFRAFTMKPPPH